jgi:hypothetical protein
VRPVLLQFLDGGEGLSSLATHQCNIRQVLIQELLPQSLHSLHCIRMLLSHYGPLTNQLIQLVLPGDQVLGNLLLSLCVRDINYAAPANMT